MVNLKKYPLVLRYFVLFLTFILLFSCAEHKYFVTKIEGKDFGITNKNNSIEAIDSYIKPYREHIDAELNTPISFASETLDKTGKWQTTIGNLLADITLQKGNAIFSARENKQLDLCLLNNGGIRSIISKGNVTLKTAFEIMPFENTSIVVALKGEQILEMLNYFIAENKPHPLSGIQFTISKTNQPISILIQGKPLDINRTYYVITSDYLANGGDRMDFFKKGTSKYDLNYKLRNILIDYFKENKTISASKDNRIIVE
jgi:2',3'-cyclic-nucleotide 2'-phosphodiesterase (5'-nucleotidase family)